jgi:hypothetical protein
MYCRLNSRLLLGFAVLVPALAGAAAFHSYASGAATRHRGGRFHAASDRRISIATDAEHVAVNQPFLVSVSIAAGDTAGSEIQLSARSSAGQTVWSMALKPNTIGAVAAEVRLPRPGIFELTARLGGNEGSLDSAHKRIEVVEDAPPWFGGLRQVSEFGLDDAIVEYVQSHGFAAHAGLYQIGLPLIVVGDAQLSKSELGSTYKALWRQVADGAHLLVLKAPASGEAQYWPVVPQMEPASSGCNADPPGGELLSGVQDATAADRLLHPSLVFRLPAEDAVEYWAFDGRRLRSGSCESAFSFRYGKGQVAFVSLPIIGNFQDALVRRYFLNLLQLEARKADGIANPILEERFESRLAGPHPRLVLAASPAVTSDGGTLYPEDAEFQARTGGAMQPAPDLVGLNPGRCFSAPHQISGQKILVRWPTAREFERIMLDVGNVPPGWPTAFTLDSSADGIHWAPLGDRSAVQPDGHAAYTPGPSPISSLRLTITQSRPGHLWRVCSVEGVTKPNAAH